MWKHPWSWVASRGADCRCKGLVTNSNPICKLDICLGTSFASTLTELLNRGWTHLWRFETGLLWAEVKILKSLSRSVGQSIKTKVCLRKWAVSGCPEFSSWIFNALFNHIQEAHKLRKLVDVLIWCVGMIFTGRPEAADSQVTYPSGSEYFILHDEVSPMFPPNNFPYIRQPW